MRLACAAGIGALMLVSCREGAGEIAPVYGGPPPLTVEPSGELPTSSASAPSAAASAAPPSSEGASLPSTPDTIPQGSGDYAEVLALATRYRRGEIGWAELERVIVARSLPPHPVGDAYLLTPSPVPPPGVKFDPRMMPKDWQGNWGEVAMAMWLGRLSRAEYHALHRAAHPSCPGD